MALAIVNTCLWHTLLFLLALQVNSQANSGEESLNEDVRQHRKLMRAESRSATARSKVLSSAHHRAPGSTPSHAHNGGKGQIPASLVSYSSRQFNYSSLQFNYTSATVDCDESRHFSYSDQACGEQPIRYSIADLMQAYHMEQNVWNWQGQNNPWYAVNTHLPQGKDLPHADKLQFYKSGVKLITDAASQFAKYGIHIVPNQPSLSPVALDLGCGLGRLANGLVKRGFQKVICVDNAPNMLDSARKHLGQLAGKGLVAADIMKRVNFVQSGPNLLCAVPKASVSFVHSYMTLQHMKPMLQVAYIEQLCDLLQVGGFGYVQIPTSLWLQDKSGHCDVKIKGVHAHAEGDRMAMHYTTEPEITRHLEMRGCQVLWKDKSRAIGESVGMSFAFAFKKGRQ